MVTHQLQVERRTGKVSRQETDVLPLCHATNLQDSRFSVLCLPTTVRPVCLLCCRHCCSRCCDCCLDRLIVSMAMAEASMPASLYADRDLCIPPTQQDYVQLLRTLTTWHCPHSPTARRCCSNQSISPARRAHREVSHTGTDRRTDTVPFHRPCSADYAGSDNNPHLEALAVLAMRATTSVSV